MKRLLLFSILILSSLQSWAQVGQGAMKGKLTDKETGEALPFVNIVLLRNGSQVTGASTDFDGNYSIKPLEPGTYTVQVTFVGYNKKVIEGVSVQANSTRFLNIELSSGVDLDAVEVVKYKIPIIQKDKTVSGETVDRSTIKNMTGRSVTAIATTSAGVSTAGTGGEISIRGGRTGGNFIYIDGVKVRGSQNLPKSAIDQISVMTGGLPANYGDATGGIISITTRGPSAQYFGGMEFITSGFGAGEDNIGLDPYGRTIVEGSIAGPLLFRDRETKKDPLLGFFLSGNFSRTEDAARSIIGHNVISEEARNQLLANPISRSEGGTGTGVVTNSELLRADDFENIDYSLNTGLSSLSLQGKLDVKTSDNINLSFGGRLAYSKFRQFNFRNALLNSEQNGLYTNLDYAVYGRFTQRFDNGEDEKSTIKNAYYSVMVDYSKTLRRRESFYHGDNYFDYGYVGKFDVYQDADQYEIVRNENGEPLYYRQSDLPGDTLVVFTPGDRNPILAKYTSTYFDMFDNKENNYETIENITSRGLRNGDAPIRTYGNRAGWNSLGAPFNFYQKFDNTQVRVSASGSADVGNHALQLGFEYEQRVDRGWTLQNLVNDERGRSTNIWSVMRNYTNFHLQNLDRSDSTLVEGDEQIPYYNFATKVDTGSQREFDRNLRLALGMNPYGDEQINIDAIDPSQLSIDYFSADDLINNGNRIVNYYGFDHHGNYSISDYFNATDANGVNTRPIGAFEPIYFAGYVMDKFEFDDIIFNVGVRVDRFDANQAVLKDQFIRNEFYTVNDLKNQSEIEYNLPTNVSDDFAVYVDDLKSATKVVGYRDGSTFYDANGNVVSAKSSAIKGNSGEVTPWLKDPENDNITVGSFEDYTPQVNVMPRISFSFPISDEALFFAHYDILTRRPNVGGRLDIIRYQYLRNVSSSAASPINNPNLRPEQTIDYELGFQQKLTNTSGLKISAFYREMRDQIQIFQNVGAYPQDYYSYDNIDFGTVKGLTIGYDLRRTGNIWMRLNYTLQFADGTGSSAGGQAVNLNNTDFTTLRTIAPLNFDQRHRINATVDYHYGEGKEYNGPKIGGKDIFANAGANLVLNLGSGTPYSGSTDSQLSQLDGTINGSRLPWNWTVQATIDKTFNIKYGEDKKKSLNLNAFLLINNLFNTKNILNVYRNTGNPDDDGYLTDPDYQTEIASNTDEASFRDIYALSLQNRNNFEAPRTIQIGFRVDF